MLKLQFVEIAFYKKERVFLENKPSQVIGHEGDVSPKISNGHISRVHATVIHDKPNDQWIVIDGSVDGLKPSRNGLYSVLSEKVQDRVILKNEGDRVYLLNIPDNQAYLEVFDTEQAKPLSKNTAGLELQIAEISTKADIVVKEIQTVFNNVQTVQSDVLSNKTTIKSVKESADVLTEKVNLLSSTLETLLEQVETVGTKPKIYLTGALISFFMFVLVEIGIITYKNIDKIIDFHLPDKKTQINKKP